MGRRRHQEVDYQFRTPIQFMVPIREDDDGPTSWVVVWATTYENARRFADRQAKRVKVRTGVLHGKA